jgi:hypothetical protein
VPPHPASPSSAPPCQGGPSGQATPHSPPGASTVPTLSLAMLDGHTSPRHPHALNEPGLDTPHSVSELLDQSGEFNDLMRFLEGEHEDNDIDF